MQCQGRTRTGLRCRNKALAGELFCDVHMRVNHGHNLTLLLPALLAILAAYFFFFSLLFNTLVFGVFDINYLAYAGLEDLFLNMLRFGGITLLLLLCLWLVYVLVLFVVFTVILLVHMIRATRIGGLSFGRRLKLIILSILVFLLNGLMMVVIRFPARNRWYVDAIGRRREAFARSLFDLKEQSGSGKMAKPIIASRQVFQDFLAFRNLGNHRFFASILLLLVISVWMTYHAGEEAEQAKACSLANHSAEQLSTQPSLPVSTFILRSACDTVASATATETPALTGTFLNSLTGFFKLKPISLQAADGQVTLLHLATTSRFDLFFNGQSGLSLAVPHGAFATKEHPEGTEEQTKGFADLTSLRQQIQALEEKVSVSNQTLFGLGKDIQSNREKLTSLNSKPVVIQMQGTAPASRSPSRHASIPEHCWNKEPDFIIPFITSSYLVDNASVLDTLAKLAVRYRANPDLSIVITGYADPSGGYRLNQRLSDKRARSISRILEKFGIERPRLFPVGMGENETTQLPPRRTEIRTCSF